jgi:hypothetical protein
VVRDKRLGSRAPCQQRRNWCLDFHEPEIVKVSADVVEDLAACNEILLRVMKRVRVVSLRMRSRYRLRYRVS